MLLCVAAGGNLLHDAGKAESAEDGIAKISRALDDGSAMLKWCAMLQSQGVAADVADALCAQQPRYDVLPTATCQAHLKATQAGEPLSQPFVMVCNLC